MFIGRLIPPKITKMTTNTGVIGAIIFFLFSLVVNVVVAVAVAVIVVLLVLISYP